MKKPLLILAGLLCSTLYSQEKKESQISWQRSIGGFQSEYLFDALPTPDYGFILAGSSVSGNTGNKTSSATGNLDYYLWKINASGQEEWQKSFGGSGADYLYSLNLTRDGGYILGGSSNSPLSGDKKEPSRGQEDYWILKLNALGEEEWQKTFGGSGSDKLLSIEQTLDGGYIVGGSSDSPQSGDKTESTLGNMDFWILKLDKEGNIQWQTTLGGKYYDLLRSIKQTKDKGYILAGYSNSPKGRYKAEDNQGSGDYWLVKLDPTGQLLWEKTLGGEKNDELTHMIITQDKGYILVGSSNSPRGRIKTVDNTNGTDIWVVKTDESGNIEWQQTYDIDKIDLPQKILQTPDRSYLIAGNSLGYNKEGEQTSDYIALKLSEKGELLSQEKIGGQKRDYLKTAAGTREGGIILAGTSTSGKEKRKTVESQGQSDFWVVKLNNLAGTEVASQKKHLEVYPNPTERFINVLLLNQPIDSNNPPTLTLTSMNGALLQTLKVKYSTTAVDLMGYAPGVYLLTLSLDGKKETVKILKSNK